MGIEVKVLEREKYSRGDVGTTGGGRGVGGGTRKLEWRGKKVTQGNAAR